MAQMRRGDLVADRFEVQELVGVGGMGEVYRAHDRLTDEMVALKVLHLTSAESSARFSRESRLLHDLRHPEIVRYVAHGVTPSGASYLAMEWLSGEDLASRLDRGVLTLAQTLSLAVQAAGAFGFAHAQGVVHRDVKPSNLFLCRPPPGSTEPFAVKVVDFGIARHAYQATQIVTATGMMLGTPSYMAPEQAKGESNVGPAADVFALGCVLFHGLAGSPPFSGDHPLAVLAKIVFEEPPPLRSRRTDVPAALDDLIARMLAKDPRQRPANGVEIAAALSKVLLPHAAPSPSDSLRSGVLTSGELRLVSVILARPLATPPCETASMIASAKTLASYADERAGAALEPTTRSFGARLETLADGTLVATISCNGSALDQAAQAARCALALRERLPRSPVVLATGRGVLAGRLPVGEAIDRAVGLLETPRATPGDCVGDSADATPPIRVDDVTAGLLDIRFEVCEHVGGHWLLRERTSIEPSRTLLGKPTPCVGRNRELSSLTGILEECFTEPVARVALVTGPAGVGKSRVLHEFLLHLRDRPEPPRIWIARGEPMRAGSPFGMLAQALRQEIGILDGESLEARHRKIQARVARRLDRDQQRVFEFLAELVGAPVPGDASVPLRAARENAQLMGDQMCRAWQDFVAAECSDRPLLFVLEDLHWGDLPSIKFIDVALRSLRDRPLMVLALARPEVHDLFPDLWAGREVVETHLGELTRKASEKLVRGVLGERIDAATVDRIVAQSDGNPFYLEELIRAVVAGAGNRLPETVLAMVQARIEALQPDARRVLRAASVYGQAFWEEGLRALLGASQATHSTDLLAELVEKEIVMRRGEAKFPGAHEYAFCHALVREAAYGMLTDADRVLGHRLAGRWLQHSGEADFVVLAEHYDRGGEYARAGSCYRRAAEQALEGSDILAVLDHTERGLRCAERAGVKEGWIGALHVARAAAQICRGDLAQAEQSGRAALDCLSPGGAIWFRAMTQIIVADGRQMHLQELLDAVAAASRAPPEPTARAAQIACLCRGVVALLIGGRFEEADRLLAEIERHFEEVATDAGLPAESASQRVASAAELHRARAFRSLYANDLGAALAEFEQATSAFEQANDRRNTCLMTCNWGVVYKSLGDYEQAESALRRSLDAAEGLGMQDVASAVRHNLGMVLAHLGRLDEALAVERQAVVACKMQGDPRLEGGSRCYLAMIEWLAGNWHAAESEARAANELLQVSPATRVSALAALARALIAQGRGDEALAVSQEGVAIVEGATHVEEGEALVRLVHAEALLSRRDLPAARDAIEHAWARLKVQADKIQDGGWRRSFLENVPENAKTLALHVELLGREPADRGREAG